jgi:hypothetical protein
MDHGSDAMSSGAILVDRTERWSLPLHSITMLGPRAGRLLSTTVGVSLFSCSLLDSDLYFTRLWCSPRLLDPRVYYLRRDSDR